jgi:hypothetical protein
MPHVVKIESASWFICYDLAKNTFHFGFAPDYSRMVSGQPNCELFASEFAMATRIDELKGIDGWYETNKPPPDDEVSP